MKRRRDGLTLRKHTGTGHGRASRAGAARAAWIVGRFGAARSCTVLAVAAVLMLVSAMSASAASPVTQTKTFASVGESIFGVPAGVSSIAVTATGAEGGAGFPESTCTAGEGAVVNATIPVTFGQTLFVEVGGAGGDQSKEASFGGSNGGGQGAADDGGFGSAGGGGASDVRTRSNSTALSSADTRLLVAGGGGGGGDTFSSTCNGGNAGSSPGAGGTSSPAIGGGPGSSSSGGSAGSSASGCSSPTTGGLGTGGNGAPGTGSCSKSGGGGGGGYFGGGGGGAGPFSGGAGGGAGSSHVESSATNVSIGTASSQPVDGPAVNGSVTFTYTVAVAPTALIASPAGGGTYTEGQTVPTSFSCTEGAGGDGIASCEDSSDIGGVTGTLTDKLNTSTAGTHTYTVTANSKDGLSDTVSITYTVVAPTPPAPTCAKSPVSFQLTQLATSGCLTLQSNGAYQTSAAVALNSIPLPALSDGDYYQLTPPSTAHPGGQFGVFAPGAAALPSVPISLGSFQVFDGVINWNLPANNGSNLGTVATLSVPSGASIAGMEIGGSIALQFGVSGGNYYSAFPLTVDLPSLFKSGPTDTSAGVTGSTSIRVDSQGVHFDGLSVQVSDVYIGALEVKSACFSYNPSGASGAVSGCPLPALSGSPFAALTCGASGGSSWSGSADIVLPVPSSPEISIYGGVANGALTSLSVEASGLKVPLAEDVFLTTVGLQLCLPTATQGLQIQGNVGVGALPEGDTYGVEIDGAFDYKDAFGGQPWSLSLGGTLSVEGTQVGQGTVTFGGTPLVTFNVSASVSLGDGLVSLSGSLGGFFETAAPNQFSVAGEIMGCISGLPCASLQAAVSSIGVAGCINLGSITIDEPVNPGFAGFFGPWAPVTTQLEAGFGFDWGGSVQLFATSCDMGDYELNAPGTAHDAASGQFVVPAGTQALAVQISGKSGAPLVDVSGPAGEAITPPASGTGERLSNGDVLIENGPGNATSLLLVKPSAGTWHVSATSASTPITGIETAANQAPPVVAGSAQALSGGREGLGVDYVLPSDETMSLFVEGPNHTVQQLGSVVGGACPKRVKAPVSPLCDRLTFTPQYGPNGTRTIVGVIDRHGVPQSQITIAKFAFVRPPTAPPTVTVTHKNGGVWIKWTRVTNAGQYAVSIKVSDGRILSVTKSGLTAFVPNVASDTKVSVVVWGFLSDGVTGKGGKAKVTAGPGCPAATGSLSGTTLGQVRLGMTRSQAQSAYSQSIIEAGANSELFCVAPDGVRVGYPSPQLLSALSSGQRTAVQGRVIWASTANPIYAIGGIRPGDTLKAAEQALPNGTTLQAGARQWYLAPVGSTTAALQVSNGGISEVGIIRAGLTRNARAERIVTISLQ